MIEESETHKEREEAIAKDEQLKAEAHAEFDKYGRGCSDVNCRYRTNTQGTNGGCRCER